ncbi:cytochrome C biogenesis protein CcmA [Sphingomonas sp. Leaf357]|uniref:heme ABC exporter ATP-binding protein CcmA n=1 Tax=Sphingomonas sp. Leaf357 TaxID=1736350 RepID=UPI0006F853D4|nr:heme ABC exporter ATP-binding protein CcmA [Sphingomonas sp. Leaf357]KQS03821.1 cytochrome C biogenesis protein CcmA [Sphingomonas sp. Leaf357]
MSAALAFDGVTCARGGRVLFADLSFTLAPGGAALVVGPNGVGKSSLVRLAAGLLRPMRGAISARGARALLGEASALDPELPLVRALGFWARIDGRADMIEEALAAFDLSALANVPMRLLSTGQRRRAGLARIVTSGADLWLLDEPANGLDAGAVAMLEAAIIVHRARGGIALVATHTPIAIHAAQHIDLGASSSWG